MAAIPDENDRSSAELAKLRAETELLEAQTRKARAEYDYRLQIEIGKMMAETDKIRAESAKIERETRWVWLAAMSTIGAAILACVAVIAVKLIHG
jgi:type IV secretory pathway component VirB8